MLLYVTGNKRAIKCVMKQKSRTLLRLFFATSFTLIISMADVGENYPVDGLDGDDYYPLMDCTGG